MIADSFWFIVLFFRFHNKGLKGINKETDKLYDNLKTRTWETLKRLSVNFFKFFIKICEQSKKPSFADSKQNLQSSVLLKKDAILKVLIFIY